jgi:L-fuculose-phosphate aldolase
MKINASSLRREMIRVTRILAERGLIRSSDGNVSARLDEQHLLITPSGLYKASMNARDLIVVDMQGNKVIGRPGLDPTSETLMHLEVYRRRPDVRAVIHAHPPYSTALTIAGKPFPIDQIPEVLVALGDVPTAQYATPGTQDLADSIRELVRDHTCILLGHHGSLTVGRSLEAALIAVERMEHAAFTCWISQAFGPAIPLPAEELERLRAIGARMRAEGKV